MIVTRLVLRNWRNFRRVDVALSDRTFIIGPNASGKSNLIDSLRFLRDIAKSGGGLQRAVLQRGGLSKIRCLAARREPEVEIAVELGESGGEAKWRYELGITQQTRGHRQLQLSHERVYRNGELILSRPDKADEQDPLRLTQTNLEQINANADFRELVGFFETIRYLHLVPQLLRQPEMFQGSHVSEDPYGRNFLEMIAKTPERMRKARLSKIEGALRRAVPQLQGLTDVKDESGVPHLEAVFAHWRPNAGRQREDQFSDGTIRLIGLFWALLDGDSVLLLEEPELSLHNAIVEKLPALIFGLQQKSKRQVLITTHSHELLSDKGIGGEEIVLLTPDPEGTTAQIGSNVREITGHLKAGLSVAEAALPRTAPQQLQFSL